MGCVHWWMFGVYGRQIGADKVLSGGESQVKHLSTTVLVWLFQFYILFSLSGHLTHHDSLLSGKKRGEADDAEYSGLIRVQHFALEWKGFCHAQQRLRSQHGNVQGKSHTSAQIPRIGKICAKHRIWTCVKNENVSLMFMHKIRACASADARRCLSPGICSQIHTQGQRILCNIFEFLNLTCVFAESYVCNLEVFQLFWCDSTSRST